MVDALKRASAKRITVVMPFYPYARQDKKHRGREPISARLIADLFKTAGADRLMTVDLHTAQIQGFFDGPVDHLFALPLLADHVQERWGDRDLVVVSPDAGRVRVAERWTDRLGCGLAIIHKRRDPNVPNEVKVGEVVGEVRGKTCILVDDMIDTGGTITKAADLLFENGAEDVIVTATHGVLSGPAIGPAQEQPHQRGRDDQHAAHRRRAALRQAHRAVDRPAARPGHQRGLRGRLGHQPVRRRRLTRPSRAGRGAARTTR